MPNKIISDDLFITGTPSSGKSSIKSPFHNVLTLEGQVNIVNKLTSNGNDDGTARLSINGTLVSTGTVKVTVNQNIYNVRPEDDVIDVVFDGIVGLKLPLIADLPVGKTYTIICSKATADKYVLINDNSFDTSAITSGRLKKYEAPFTRFETVNGHSDLVQFGGSQYWQSKYTQSKVGTVIITSELATQPVSPASSGNNWRLVGGANFSGANGQYLDDCQVATVGNFDIAAYEELDVIDAYMTEPLDRILVWKQTDPTENGIYQVSGLTGATGLYRTQDCAVGVDLSGSFTHVQLGATYTNMSFRCVSSPSVVGTDAIEYAAFSPSGPENTVAFKATSGFNHDIDFYYDPGTQSLSTPSLTTNYIKVSTGSPDNLVLWGDTINQQVLIAPDLTTGSVLVGSSLTTGRIDLARPDAVVAFFGDLWYNSASVFSQNTSASTGVDIGTNTRFRVNTVNLTTAAGAVESFQITSTKVLVTSHLYLSAGYLGAGAVSCTVYCDEGSPGTATVRICNCSTVALNTFVRLSFTLINKLA
jgi:hypothetical protein